MINGLKVKASQSTRRGRARSPRRAQLTRDEVERPPNLFVPSRSRHTRYWRDWSSDVCSSDLVVVQLARRGRFWTGEPFFERGRRVVVERDKRLSEGALALLRTTGTGRGQAKLVKLIGRPDVTRDVLEALMLDRGLRRRFDPAVDREARGAAEGEGRPTPNRRALRDLPTFTIDPATAKDFDDAISAEALGEDRWRVWVHTADVCAFVPAGSLVNREAYRRSTSVYVPGLVEPMLPEALSNQACSLVPFQDRLAVTVEMEFEGHELVRSAFHRSVIRSDARMDYPQVDRIFAGDERAEGRIAEPLGAAREVEI